MKKRLIAILLTFSIVLSIFSFFAYADYSLCAVCSSNLYVTSDFVTFGCYDLNIYYCPECDAYYVEGIVGNDDFTLFELGAGDNSIIDEYLSTSRGGSGGSFSTTTDDDGNATTEFEENITYSSYYINSDGLLEIKCIANYVYNSSTSSFYSLLDNGRYYGIAYNHFKGFSTLSGLKFSYSVDIPLSAYYNATFNDCGYIFHDDSGNQSYVFDSSILYCSSSSYEYGSSVFLMKDVSVSPYIYYSVDTSAENYIQISGTTSDILDLYSPVLYLTYDTDSNSSLSFITNDYSNITVNGDIITGDYIYNLDYSTTDSFNSSNYSSSYYVYDNDDSSSYTVYNVDSSTGEVVSSYYYDNSTGDTVTYLTIYESDTFTDDEMYPSSGDDDSTSSDSSGNAWTELFSDLFSGIADFIAAIIGGALELLISLVDELASAVTSLMDTVTSLFTSVLDFGGDFSGFLAVFFDWIPDEIVVLLQLSIALPLLLMVIKFLINMFM